MDELRDVKRAWDELPGLDGAKKKKDKTDRQTELMSAALIYRSFQTNCLPLIPGVSSSSPRLNFLAGTGEETTKMTGKRVFSFVLFVFNEQAGRGGGDPPP